MPAEFPATPAIGQQFVRDDGVVYRWEAPGLWVVLATTPDVLMGWRRAREARLATMNRVRVTEDGVTRITDRGTFTAGHIDPYWPWCVMPGATRTTQLKVDQIDYGDGYIHRATRGLHPARPQWNVQVPFTDLAELDAYNNFLVGYGTGGFWFTPPDSAADAFVYADEWAASIVDKNQSGIVGTLSATFVQCFNPQPAP
jgi:phage-related protein